MFGGITFPWKRRWWLTCAILVWCACAATFIIVKADGSNRLHETALEGIYLLVGSVAGAYLGFATWDDRHARSVMRRRRKNDPDPPTEGEPEN